MSRKEINRIKNKVRLWCVLHGIKMGNRYTENGDFAYNEACDTCRGRNEGLCLGAQKIKENKPLLILDTKRMVLHHQSTNSEKINKQSLKNKYLWCVEWVNYV